MLDIRPIRPDEWPAYRALRLQALRDAPDAFGSTYDLEAARADELWAARLAAAATSGLDRAVFARAEGQACGLAWCKRSAAEPGVADLFQMWVAPAWRGRGFGAALVRDAITFATMGGAHMLRLGVAVGETPAVRLYRSFGFVPAGEPEPLRPGSPLQAQTLHLRLPWAG